MREIVFYPWNPVSAIPKPPKAPQKPRRDRMRLARYYQSLLDSGKFESRAALARTWVSAAHASHKSCDDSRTKTMKHNARRHRNRKLWTSPLSGVANGLFRCAR